MTRPSQRTHGRRKLAIRTPSGRRTFHFEPRVPSKGQCARCGAELHGVPASKPQSVAKSSRVPSRPFGGILCPNCLTAEVRTLVRSAGSTA